jgi:glucans biosynthesis protein C
MNSNVEIGPKKRIAYLDNLKALMIIFVVIMHTAVTYSGVGSWYYVEKTNLPTLTLYSFIFFQSFLQAFFMSLLFLISGYFLPASLEKKGVKKFIKDRLIRLGIPCLFYIFLIHLICIKMIKPEINLITYYLHGLYTLKFLSWTGPLWFVLALLIFNLLYLLIKNFIDRLSRLSFEITTKNILFLVLLITIFTFILRLFFYIDTSILNFQLANFSAYVILFFLGVIAYQKNLFDKIDFSLAKKWLYLAFAIGVPLWIFVVYTAVEKIEHHFVFLGKGGFNIHTFLYALWESFFCVSIIIALIGIFKTKYDSQNKLQKFLSDNCFGVYVFHSPILIITAILLKNVTIEPILKCLIVASIVIPVTYLLVSVIRLVPIFRKIFS